MRAEDLWRKLPLQTHRTGKLRQNDKESLLSFLQRIICSNPASYVFTWIFPSNNVSFTLTNCKKYKKLSERPECHWWVSFDGVGLEVVQVPLTLK